MEHIAAAAGASVPALKLLLSVLAGYPLAILYNLLPHSTPAQVKWAFSALAGFALAVFCYDIEAVHSLAAIVGTWALLAVVPRRHVAAAVFVFNLGYLLGAYYYVSTEESYDIDFTMVHCVLTLRLIGLGFDYSDGGRPEKDLGEYARANRLEALPSLPEVLGFAYHWAGLVVGPQYSLATYRQFLSGADRVRAPSPAWPALQTALLGVLYLAVNVVSGQYLSTTAVLADDFVQRPLWWRIAWMWITFRLLLFRYAAMWLLADGHCILSGLGYAGVDRSTGQHRWDRVSNFYPARMLTATSIADVVGAFNVNTNAWVKEYVFKRLRFLNNRHLSSAGSLLFLALWHGFAPGYFFTFVLEFLDSFAETALLRLVAPLVQWSRVAAPPVYALLRLLGYLLVSIMLAAGLVAFDLKTFNKSVLAYDRLLWLMWIVPAAIIVVDRIVGVLRPRASKAGGKAKPQ